MKKIYVLLAGIFALSLIFFLRFTSQSELMGNEAYYHLDISEKINENPSIIGTNLYLREYKITLFDMLLAIYPDKIFAQIITTFFGILAGFLFYLILNEFIPKTKEYSLILLYSSPGFMYLLSFINIHSLAIFLSLASMYFYIKNRKIISNVFAFLLIFISPFNLILLLGLFLVYKKNLKEKEVYYLSFYAIFSSVLMPDFFIQYTAKGFFVDLGSHLGLSIILFVFYLAGTFLFWKKLKWITLLFLPLFLLSFVFSDILLYVNFFVAVVAGLLLNYFVKLKWEEKTIRNISFFVIFSSFLFSTLAYANFTANSPPKDSLFSALEELSKIKSTDGLVLASEDKSMVLSYFKLNSFFKVFDTERNKKINQSKQIFLSRNLKNTKKLMELYNIKYILIDKLLRNYLIENNEGLLFIVNNEESFEKIYEQGGVQIYRYKGVNTETNS